ncbi:hypothetical protein ABPG72_021289 [Tetrahymena utriculariae]
MNNFRYQINIYKLQNRHSFVFNLKSLDLNDKITALSQFIIDTEEKFQVEVILGSGIGQLVDKSTLQDEFYDRIRYNLAFVMNYIDNIYGLEMIQIFTFMNLDCLLNVEDILFQLI